MQQEEICRLKHNVCLFVTNHLNEQSVENGFPFWINFQLLNLGDNVNSNKRLVIQNKQVAC